MANQVVLLTIPQLRGRDVTPGGLRSLETLASIGLIAPLIPPFPGLASPAFATLMTGLEPEDHGLIGNAFFDRETRQVYSAPFSNRFVNAPKLWDRLLEHRPDAKVLLWFVPNARDVDISFSSWIDASNTIQTVPADLLSQIQEKVGERHQDEEMTPMDRFRENSEWILKSASFVIGSEQPELSVVRVPMLGQVARRYGPDSPEAGRAVDSLEQMLAQFIKSLPDDTAIVAVTESIVTPVVDVVFPNRVLRSMGYLKTKPAPSGGQCVDLERSSAFALADHQICHIYLNDTDLAGPLASYFSGEARQGVDHVISSSQERDFLGLDHPHSGDLLLVASPDAWFAPHWWNADDEFPADRAESTLPIPDFAGRTLDPEQVLGSLGAPPPNADYLGLVISSKPVSLDLPEDEPVPSRSVMQLVLDLLNVPSHSDT